MHGDNARPFDGKQYQNGKNKNDVILNIHGHEIIIPGDKDPVRQLLLGELEDVANGAGPDPPIQTREEKSRNKFKLIPFNEVGFSSRIQYLVKGIIPKRSVVCLYGAPKEGKSFITLDMAMHVALGWPYRGQKVEQGTVIYLIFEGQAGFPNRVLAFRQEYLPGHKDFVPFYTLPIRMNLIKEDKDFIKAVKEQGVRPDLIVLDTLNRSIPDGKEDGPEFTQYFKAADALSDAFGCSVLVVHHSRLDGDRPRGSTVLTGNVDAQLRVTKATDGVISMEMEDAKDLAEGTTFRSKLEVVTVGTDDEGDPVTSCVVTSFGPTLSPEDTEAEKRKANNAVEVAHRILQEMLKEKGTVAPAGDMHVKAGVRTIELKEWKDYCTKSPDFSRARGDKSRDRQFSRARESLSKLNRIEFYGSKVSIP